MKNILIAFLFAAVQVFSMNAAFAKEKEVRGIASDVVVQDTWEGIPQDKKVMLDIFEALNKEPRFKKPLSPTLTVIGVYELGMKYRCACYDFIVKFKDQDQVWFEAAKLSQGQIKWGIGNK